MWAGGRVSWNRHLLVGDPVERISTVRAVSEKSGRSGALVFVTVEHRYAGAGGDVALIEEQDIVSTGKRYAGVPPRPPEPPPCGSAWRADQVLLFRYSALTYNGHRIHYDRAYAQDVEGYPDLVVHGPLLATLMLNLVRRQRPEAAPVRFAFTARSPVFVDRPIIVAGCPDGPTSLRLWVAHDDGSVGRHRAPRLSTWLRRPAFRCAGAELVEKSGHAAARQETETWRVVMTKRSEQTLLQQASRLQLLRGQIDRRRFFSNTIAAGLGAAGVGVASKYGIGSALAQERPLNSHLLPVDHRPPPQRVRVNAKFPGINAQVAPVEGFGIERFVAEARKKKESTWDVYVGQTPFVEMSAMIKGDVIEPWDAYIPKDVLNDIIPSIREECTIDGRAVRQDAADLETAYLGL